MIQFKKLVQVMHQRMLVDDVFLVFQQVVNVDTTHGRHLSVSHGPVSVLVSITRTVLIRELQDEWMCA